MFKKVKVVMLPTNEKAKICLDYTKLTLHQTTLINCTQSWQHLYFLSDEEEIKEGDWFIMNGCIIRQCKSTNNEPHTIHTVVDTTGGIHHVSVCEKVIATTDKSLVEKVLVKRDEIGDLYRSFYLPEPSQSFIEKFVEEYNKGNVITEVMVEYEWNKTDKKIREVEIFDDVLKINPKDNTITIRKIKDSWNRAEQTDVIEKYLLMKEPDVYRRTNRTDIKKWIEENL